MWVWGGGCRAVGVSVGVWEVGAGRWVWVTGVGNSCTCTSTKIYILRARLYHFIFVCPISHYLSYSVWSAKQIGGVCV